jgi:glycosyltransferase involved in cell wall biosynthesis
MTAAPGANGLSDLRVALVHDWLTGMRGGEKVLEILCELFPRAEIFTLLHVRGSVSDAIERRRPRTTFVQRLPLTQRFYRHYLPLFPSAIEQLDLDEIDLVVSSSHCAAKAVVRPGRARHVCYCHTPMRYAWDQYDAYFGATQIGVTRSWLLRPVLARLARWDQDTAARVDRFVANSQHVARRIRRYYNRAATVIYPPVDTTFFSPNGSAPQAYFLIVSALVPYKRIDVAIEACRLARAPLKVVGQGPELARLARLAPDTVEFLGSRTDEEIRDLYRGAAAVLLPGEEDFGIVPVEAQACGRPVVALARGGVLETLEPDVTGVLVEDESAPAFAEGLDRVRRLSLDPVAIRSHALRFSRERFSADLRSCIVETLDAPRDQRW